ncbi:hypothetical protein [Prevotella intermedia]|uniref:hypothetical protein n=1 Tax=Prevotella intermedia TaxID=28131 RepID=UPI0012FE36B7|nr:hypothetical protein [Prevotella intermedia]
MKKYSVEAKELLSSMELYEIKAGTNDKVSKEVELSDCTICASCLACTSCMACTSKAMDVIIAAAK